MADEPNNSNAARVPFKAITAVLTLTLSLGGVVSWVQATFVSQQELSAIREVVERAEATLSHNINEVESKSRERSDGLDVQIDRVRTDLTHRSTEIVKMVVAHQTQHIAGCPAPE